MSPHNSSINLKELSYLTGFSVSTVSKALNDKFDISEKTKRFITSVAEDHNYVPNSFAVGLRNKKSRTIAVILPQINIEFYSNLLFHFQKIAARKGYRVVVFQSFEKEEKEIEYLKSVCDGSIDGSIVFTNNKNNLYAEDYSIPVASILISKEHNEDELNEYCFKIFEKLLVQIG
ncbi:putative LacI-family transcriptional regulator [unidentified eubacterium SCB49]|nr:putative LacI-family transcriptional regulator [unidentified eubacterium SCB49]